MWTKSTPVVVHARGVHISLTDISAPNEFSLQCSLAKSNKGNALWFKKYRADAVLHKRLNLNAALRRKQ